MYVVLWLKDVDREWGKKDSISAAEPQHTQPAYPATIQAGQRLKKKKKSPTVFLIHKPQLQTARFIHPVAQLENIYLH